MKDRNSWSRPQASGTPQQSDADSRRTTLLLGLGSKRRYEYDSVGRITTQIELNSSNQRIYTMVDSYDAVGNRTGRNTNGNPTTWLYDDAYRLTGQQKSGQTATFAYERRLAECATGSGSVRLPSVEPRVSQSPPPLG